MNSKVFLSTALAAIMLMGCQPEQQTEPVAQPLRPVRTVTVAAQTAERVRIFSGLSESVRSLRVSFKVSGTLKELPIEVGKRLKKGDLIAVLDASTYTLQTQQSKASLEQALANQRNAAASYRRNQALYENNNLSRADLDASRARAESTKAEVRAARKSLEISQISVADTRLYANEDCSVASVGVEINENINTSHTVASLNCGQAVNVSVDVPEGLIGQFRAGMAATVQFDALAGRRFNGQVIELGVASNQGAATFPITVRILDEDIGSLRAGLAADVAFRLGDASALTTLVVPTSALAKDSQGEFVYLLQSANGQAKVARQPVSSGDITSGGVQILSGLQPGQQVVTAGVSLLRDGQAVAPRR